MCDFIKCDSEDKFINEICKTISREANIAIKDKGSFSFVLSGGNTPKLIFDKLALSYQNKIDWSKVDFFWLDERCVEPSHKDSNYRLAYDSLISKVKSTGKVFRIKGESEPKIASKEYEKIILKYFEKKKMQFDFILIGMGEDGHIASIFPNNKEIINTKDIVLSTEEKYNGYYRISLGLNIINNSSYKLLMFKGVSKLNVFNNKLDNLPVHKIKYSKVIVGDCSE